MQVTPTGAFLRNLKKLSKRDNEAVIAALERFLVNHRTPILNFEPVISRKNYFSIRANIKIRVLLWQIGDDHFEAVAVGNHDYIYARYFRK